MNQMVMVMVKNIFYLLVFECFNVSEELQKNVSLLGQKTKLQRINAKCCGMQTEKYLL
jgi:hypothetical protein